MSSPAKAEEGATPKKKGKLPLIIIGAVLVLGGGGAGAWYFMGSKHAAEPKEVKAKPPVFAALENFTVNLMPEGASQNYLQTAMTLKVADAAVAEDVKQNMAEVRNRILFLLSSKKASELLTTAGKRKLSDEILRETLAVISPGDAEREAKEKKLEKERERKRAARKKAESEEASNGESGETTESAGKGEKSAAKKGADAGSEEEEDEPPPPPRKPPPAPKLLGVLFTSFIIQ